MIMTPLEQLEHNTQRHSKMLQQAQCTLCRISGNPGLNNWYYRLHWSWCWLLGLVCASRAKNNINVHLIFRILPLSQHSFSFLSLYSVQTETFCFINIICYLQLQFVKERRFMSSISFGGAILSRPVVLCHIRSRYVTQSRRALLLTHLAVRCQVLLQKGMLNMLTSLGRQPRKINKLSF